MSSTTPTFSVVIPTYNRASCIARCLDSLLSQTFNDFEVLVCDDGSTDNTQEIVAQYKNSLHIRYFWNENWGGPARPRNIGIQNAKSEWICFLDSDDWWYPRKLEECIPHLDADIIYHNLDVVSIRGIQARMQSRHLKQPVFLDLIGIQNALPNSSVVVRTSILKQINGISEDKNIAVEDYHTWLKISTITDRFCFINQYLGAYWIDELEHTNISSKIDAIKNDLYVYHLFESMIPLEKRSVIQQSHYFYLARNIHRTIHPKKSISIYRTALWGPDILLSFKSVILIVLAFLSIRR